MKRRVTEKKMKSEDFHGDINTTVLRNAVTWSKGAVYISLTAALIVVSQSSQSLY